MLAPNKIVDWTDNSGSLRRNTFIFPFNFTKKIPQTEKLAKKKRRNRRGNRAYRHR